MKEPEIIDEYLEIIRLQSELEITIEANSKLLEADRVKSLLIEHLQKEIEIKEDEIRRVAEENRKLREQCSEWQGMYIEAENRARDYEDLLTAVEQKLESQETRVIY